MRTLDIGWLEERGSSRTPGCQSVSSGPWTSWRSPDHAEMIGLAPAIAESSPKLLAEPWGKWMHERFHAGQEGRMEAVRDVVDKGTSGVNPFSSDEMSRSIWGETIQIAEQYNEPGRFTAIAGFEWTSTPNGDNLHRVVVFRDGADKTSQTLPFSLFDSIPTRHWLRRGRRTTSENMPRRNPPRRDTVAR